MKIPVMVKEFGSVGRGQPSAPIGGQTGRRITAYHQEGHFPQGSMGPKSEAAIRFLEGGGKRAIISHLDHAMPALCGETGTHIVH
jgi:carbamate kinase